MTCFRLARMWNAAVEPDRSVFNRKQRLRDEYAFTRSQHWFSLSRWSICLDLFCRDTPLRSVCSSALMDPAAELIHLAVQFASWLSHRDEANRLFVTASPRQVRCDVCLSQSGALHSPQHQQTTRCVDPITAARFCLTRMHSNAT